MIQKDTPGGTNTPTIIEYITCLLNAGLSILLESGVRQKTAADILKVSEQSITAWLREYPEVKAKVKAVRRGELTKPVNTYVVLPSYMAWLMVHHPKVYKQNMGPFMEYIQTNIPK